MEFFTYVPSRDRTGRVQSGCACRRRRPLEWKLKTETANPFKIPLRVVQN